MAEDLAARIPEPALLFALKLHSGWLADARDLMVVGSNAELDRIERYIHRGSSDVLAAQIEGILGQLENVGFADSFKGVFQQGKVPVDDMDSLIEFLRTQRTELERGDG